MQPRDSFSEEVQNILKNYQTMHFKRQEMLLCLKELKQPERLKALTRRMHDYNDNVLTVFMHGGHGNYVDLKESIDYLCSINALLSETDRKAFIDTITYPAIYNIMRCVLTSRQLNETEREELTGMLCKFIKENMLADNLNRLFHSEVFDKKSFLDYAKLHCSQSIIEPIYELTNGKKLEKHQLSFKNIFHAEKKRPQQEKMVAKVRHENQVSLEEKKKAIMAGKKELLPVFGFGYDAKHDQETRELNAYVISCLSSDIGTYAVGSGLLTFENAREYAKNRTLEYFLEDPGLPFLRLFRPEQLKLLKSYQIQDVKGDYAFFALEEKIVTCEQLASLSIEDHYAMSDIFTYYGIVALRENLLSFNEALAQGRKSISTLEALFTAEGIAGLRKEKARESCHP